MAPSYKQRDVNEMAELLQANWWLLLIALLIGVLVAWWILVASRKTKIEVEDKGDEETSARRNQALIDAPPAAAKDAVPPPTPTGMAGVGVAVAAAAQASSEPAGTAPKEPEPLKPAVQADDLTRIKGVGPKLAALLTSLGITSFAQIASWDDAAIDAIDAKLGRFEGRIRRDNWVDQARLLAADDTAGFEERFGKV